MSFQPIKASDVAKRTRNPIRQIVDNLKVNPNPEKPFISLALGDPTVFGNLKIHDSCVDAVVRQVQGFKANGYGPSIGSVAAREAIANYYTHPNAPLTANDIVIASGCSDALNLCIGALCNPSHNILLPLPGFSLYETLASSKGIECKFYRLLPEKQWEADLDHLESLIDKNTACILINNPSNPCGSVYSKEHLKGILDIAERHRLPIISDEIYADMVFTGESFHPLATLTNTVPILTCGGLAKRYLVPGWRVGWIFIHDKNKVFDEVRAGIINLSQLIIGSNSIIQAAIPEILATDNEFHRATNTQLEKNALLSVKLLSNIPGITVVAPQGAMYLMLKINIEEFKGFKDDVEFVEGLVREQSVLCLPGQCFRCPEPYVRIVFSPPIDKLQEAYDRIREFCAKHHI
ncbi:pyridoxal phosphate-dependent transferase [Globomyces pollinis-pini]|nr:pyridoxal phosphate-dependent transferase [Globomyces pollinis-pini]